MKNDFVGELLAYQQDGRSAISSPVNWLREAPLLRVSTPLDQTIQALAGSMLLQNCSEGGAQWHFIIGSPGNGKSAAMGTLCRELISRHGCSILTEDGSDIRDLDTLNVPYELRVFEHENRFPSVMIIQDASVVRRPFESEVDPASELVQALTAAWSRGTSLVVCTNRGVLEKAFQERYLDSSVNNQSWFRILSRLVKAQVEAQDGVIGEWRFDSPRPVFEKTNVSFTHLENLSLLGSGVFEQLVIKSVDEANWASCNECASLSLCPFKANRDWLARIELRERFIRILRRAEVLDGQVIVFREALALLSFVLAGCPRDYAAEHPCEWVGKMVAADNIFALAVRRIYMCLFASYTSYGFEKQERLLANQIRAVKFLHERVESETIRRALAWVAGPSGPSTDVGVRRLLGDHGALAELDPCREFLPASFLAVWDGEYSMLQNFISLGICEIEKRCLDVWRALEDQLESIATYEANECNWAVKRWSSNFLLHCGALLEGRTGWSDELDEFVSLISPGVNVSSAERLRWIRRVSDDLERVLAAGQLQSVRLNDNVTLQGPYVAQRLKPRLVSSDDNARSLSLVVTVGEEKAFISARAYAWMRRHGARKISLRCMPEELLLGVLDARSRAAVKGEGAYAFVGDGVELKVDLLDDGIVSLVRFGGGVQLEQ